MTRPGLILSAALIGAEFFMLGAILTAVSLWPSRVEVEHVCHVQMELDEANAQVERQRSELASRSRWVWLMEKNWPFDDRQELEKLRKASAE